MAGAALATPQRPPAQPTGNAPNSNETKGSAIIPVSDHSTKSETVDAPTDDAEAVDQSAEATALRRYFHCRDSNFRRKPRAHSGRQFRRHARARRTGARAKFRAQILRRGIGSNPIPQMLSKPTQNPLRSGSRPPRPTPMAHPLLNKI